jgi:uncharacterized protein (TIGR02117 family)
MRPGDPALFPVRPGDTGIDVTIVSHGYHSGLALRRDDLMRAAEVKELPALQEVLGRFKAYEYLEFGWGDDGFYHRVRTVSDLQWTEAARALLMPNNPSVMHVVGLMETPRSVFPKAEIVVIAVSEPGFAKLAYALNASFACDEDEGGKSHTVELGAGLYGPSLFYKATGHFNLLHVCNHWVAHLLEAAGVPTNPVLATLPQGLFYDLALRAGSRELPSAGR